MAIWKTGDDIHTLEVRTGEDIALLLPDDSKAVQVWVGEFGRGYDFAFTAAQVLELVDFLVDGGCVDAGQLCADLIASGHDPREPE